MNKLFSRLGTQPQKFLFLLTLISLSPKFALPPSPNTCYRLCLRRQDKLYYSSYFKLPFSSSTTVKFPATLYYNKNEKEYQSKMFEVVMMRCEREGEKQEGRWRVDVGEIVGEKGEGRMVRRVLESSGGRIEIQMIGEMKEKGQSISPVRKSYPQQSHRYTLPLSKQLKPNNEIELIRFDDQIQAQGPVRNTIDVVSNGMVSASGGKEVSFKNVKMVEREDRSKEKEMRREQRRKSRENMSGVNKTLSTVPPSTLTHPNPNLISIIPPPFSFPPTLHHKLSSLQSQLDQQRLRKSTLFSSMTFEKDQLITKLKEENSRLSVELGRCRNELEFAGKEVKELEGRCRELEKKVGRMVQEEREGKEKRERLANENAELVGQIIYLKSVGIKENGMRSGKEIRAETENRTNLQISSLTKQLQKYKKANLKLSQQLHSLDSQKLLVQHKYQQLLKKYKTVSFQLSSSQTRFQQFKRKIEGDERHHIVELKRRQEELILAKRVNKELELKLMSPSHEMSKKQHQILKNKMEKLQVKMLEDSKQSKQLQSLFKKEIERYKKQSAMLYQKMGTIEKSYNDEMGISINRQKSLNKALVEKDKKLAEQNKELSKIRETLAQNNRFIESEKVDLIMKMRVLNEQLVKRKDTSQELQQAEKHIRQLKNQLKMLSSSGQQAEIELSRLKKEIALGVDKVRDYNSALSLVQELQGQLVKLNMRQASVMGMVFESDPGLAQSIIQNMRQI